MQPWEVALEKTEAAAREVSVANFAADEARRALEMAEKAEVTVRDTSSAHDRVRPACAISNQRVDWGDWDSTADQRIEAGEWHRAGLVCWHLRRSAEARDRQSDKADLQCLCCALALLRKCQHVRSLNEVMHCCRARLYTPKHGLQHCAYLPPCCILLS